MLKRKGGNSLFQLAVISVSVILLCLKGNAQNLNGNMGCQLVALIPFTDERSGPPIEIQDEGVEYYGYGVWPDQETLERASFSLMAAAEMAVTHFNTRNQVIVPQLTELEGKCEITLPNIIFRNSGYSRTMAVDELLDVTRQTSTNDGNSTQAICAVLGPTHPRANEGVSAITENLWIPQLAYSTIDRRLSRMDDFPTLARTITSSQDYGFAIANFLQRDVLKRDFLAIIYDASDYGEQYEDPLEDAEDFLESYSTITEHIIEGNPETIEESLKITKDDGYHSILLATDRLALLDDVANVADKLELLGEEYFWILSGDMLTPAMLPLVRFPKDSPPDRLLRGAAVFSNYDPFVYNGESDPFLKAWRQQDSAFVDKLNERNPTDKEAIISDRDTYFQTEMPTEYASFLYDSVMAAGISACKAWEKAQNGMDVTHVSEIFESDFQGASGYVQFSSSEISSELTKGRLNGRDISGVMYGMYNIRPIEHDEGNMHSYELVLTHVYTNETQVSSNMPVTGSWAPVEGAEFLFYDGTTTEPSPLKSTSDFNYLSHSFHVLGLFLTAVGLAITIGSGLWVYSLRANRLVKASQPEFLYLLCFGGALVSASLFFISWDEDKGATEDQLSAYCSVFPWFFIIGYQIMYMALFFKLWRLSKLMSMRRQVVQINQVIPPFAAVVSCSIIVLLIWQIIDPLTWVREITNADADGPYISYAECNSEDRGVLPFITPLGFIIGASVVMTGIFSWKLKDVQAELSESKWIFFGIFSQAQIWAIGIPLFIILDGVSRDASYLISAALTFCLSVSLVILVIWPKVYVWARDKYFGGPPKPGISINVDSRPRSHVSGIDSVRTTNASRTSADAYGCSGGEKAQVEANARKIEQLEEQIEQMKSDHEHEKDELKQLVNHLRAQHAEVEHSPQQQVGQTQRQQLEHDC